MRVKDLPAELQQALKNPGCQILRHRIGAYDGCVKVYVIDAPGRLDTVWFRTEAEADLMVRAERIVSLQACPDA